MVGAVYSMYAEEVHILEGPEDPVNDGFYS